MQGSSMYIINIRFLSVARLRHTAVVPKNKGQQQKSKIAWSNKVDNQFYTFRLVCRLYIF